MIRVRQIVYPTDFSSYSNQAYFHAVGLAEAYGAELNIVYVYAPGLDTEVPGGAGRDRAYWKRQLEQVRPANRDIPVRHVFLEGDPGSEIVRWADENGADVIVIGTHGRTGVDRLVMGSVAERVMREAHCSVLVVKLPQAPMSGKFPRVVATTGA
jgi:nucleotide-binding universal stress UspA family protein